MDEIGIIYFALSSMVILIILAGINAFGGKISADIALIIALGTFGFLAIMNWADYIAFPAITKLIGLNFRISKEYKVTKTQDAIIKNVNGLYYATGFLTANFFKYEIKSDSGQIEEADPMEKIRNAPGKWEQALISIDFPFKLHVIAFGRDVQAERDELVGKKSYKEFQLSRMAQNANTTEASMADLQQKIASIDDKIRRLSQGERPIATIMYFESIAVGVSEKAAADNLSAQLNRLQIAMSVLDLDIRRVMGRDLYSLFNFNFALPANYEEASSYFDVEGG